MVSIYIRRIGVETGRLRVDVSKGLVFIHKSGDDNGLGFEVTVGVRVLETEVRPSVEEARSSERKRKKK